MVDIGAMIRRDIPPEHVGVHAASLAPVFSELWVVEDTPFAGGIAQLGEVLRTTEDIVIGHGIAPAPFRNPMALAMEWAALIRQHPDRLHCGLGHGVQRWMADIGEQVGSPLTLLEETAVVVQQLLAGAEPDFEGRYRSVHRWRLEFPPDRMPPVSLGAVGPRTLELSGRIAQGTIIPEGHGPDQVRVATEHIQRGREQAGRSDPHRLTLFCGFYCGALDELPAPPSEEMIQGWEAVGSTADEVADALAGFLDTDVDCIVLVPYGDPQSQLELAAGEILPLLS